MVRHWWPFPLVLTSNDLTWKTWLIKIYYYITIQACTGKASLPILCSGLHLSGSVQHQHGPRSAKRYRSHMQSDLLACKENLYIAQSNTQRKCMAAKCKLQNVCTIIICLLHCAHGGGFGGELSPKKPPSPSQNSFMFFPVLLIILGAQLLIM